MPAIGAANLVALTLIIAILGIVFIAADIPLGAALFGAVGLILGGYCMGYVRRHAGADRKLLAVSAVALLLSVVSFMLGFVGAL